MHKYEAMFIIKPDLPEEETKNLLAQITDSVNKNEGKVLEGNIWSEKRKLYFPLKKCQEGVYYLLHFAVLPEAIVKIRHAYKLNENILRILITKIG